MSPPAHESSPNLAFQFQKKRGPIEKLLKTLENHFCPSKLSPRCHMFQTTASLPYLNFALWIIPQDRSFISHLLSLAASKPSLRSTITLENSSKAKLRLWQLLLANWTGISFFYDIQLYTDAAPSASFGGYYGRRWFTSAWPPEFCHYIQEWFLPSSAVFEIYPVVISALLWGHKWSKRSILIHSDNLTVAHIINKGQSNSPSIMPLMHLLMHGCQL